MVYVCRFLDPDIDHLGEELRLGGEIGFGWEMEG